MAFGKSILNQIGNTPLVEATRLINKKGVRLFLKLEGNNPGGSVKDRPAFNMINEALKRGDIKEGGTLVEATSGNTGIGLAAICAAKGLKLILTMPESMSIERRKILTHFQ